MFFDLNFNYFLYICIVFIKINYLYVTKYYAIR